MFLFTLHSGKNSSFTTKQSIYTRAFLSVVLVILISFSLPQARADDFRDLDTLEGLKSKWDKVKKNGLTADDVKKFTEKLKKLGGSDLDNTGVGKLLDAINANAKRLAKLKGTADKLAKMIALVEKLKKLGESDQFDAKATLDALAAVIGLMSDLMKEVPPPFGTIAGPLLKAYAKAVENSASHAEAIQKATKAKNEAIAAAGGDWPETKIPEDVEDSFEWNVYPYKAFCPKCENDWWSAGNSEARADTLGAAYERAKQELDALSAQAKETYDRLIREGYRERTAERMSNEQEAIYDGRTMPMIDAIDWLSTQVDRRKQELEKKKKHAKRMKQIFLDCLETCNIDAGGEATNNSEEEDTRLLYPVAVTCQSTGMLCTPEYSVEITTDGPLRAQFHVSPSHCGSMSLMMRVNGIAIVQSGFLGIAGAAPTSTKIVSIGGAGTHKITLQATGKKGGCIEDDLQSWAGTLQVWRD